MARPAHQDIETLATDLDRRAELEGMSRGLRIRAARQFTRWTAGWLFALAAALAIGWSSPALWWLPIPVLVFAALTLTFLAMTRRRLLHSLDKARHRAPR